jgi:hypothetical protein
MENPTPGLSTGADPAFLAAFLAGEIQRDYMGLVLDDEPSIQAKGKDSDDSGDSGKDCQTDQSPCCPSCGCHDSAKEPCHQPKTPPKKRAASWFTTP